MTYELTHADGSNFMRLGEGMVDQSLGISLIGQNVHNYGKFIANNFIHMLENQSNDTPPLNPIEGQLWWDSGNKLLHYFDGDRFKVCATTALSDSPPIKPQEGDQWWDTSTDQLKIYNGDEWVLIGPLNPKGNHFSGIMPNTVTDTNGRQHTIATVSVDGSVISVLSRDEQFDLSMPISGITTVGTGETIAPGSMITGTSLNALQLGGVVATNYVRTTDPSTTLQGWLAVKNANGLLVGVSTDPMRMYTEVNGQHVIKSTSTNVALSVSNTYLTVNGVDNTVTISTEPTALTSVTTKRYVDTSITANVIATKNYVDSKVSSFTGNVDINSSILDTLSKLSTAINHDPVYYVNVNAAIDFKSNVASPKFTGYPEAPTQPVTDQSTKIATTEFVYNVIENGVSKVGELDELKMNGDILPTVDNVFNVGSPSLRFKNFHGIAMKANYADLAENYKSDKKYGPGTVVVFGGEYEITASTEYADYRVAGIVSTDPAYLMNSSEDEAYIPVALTGKVPCSVIGHVRKGDLLVTSTVCGVATALDPTNWVPGCVIGKSLENNTDEGIRIIEVAVGRF